jgi:hypothetical protein
VITRHLLGQSGLKAEEADSGAGELKIIAAILERLLIQKILSPLGLDPQPSPKGRAREPGLHFAA